MRPLAYSMTLNNWCQIVVWKCIHWRSHPSLKTWRRFKEKCATSKVISCIYFLIETFWLGLRNGYMNHNWIIMRIFIISKFKMINFLRGFNILVLSPMFRIVIGYIAWRILMTSGIMRKMENCRFFICFNMILMRANH